MMAFEDYFSFQIFFIFLRESLEIIIIISILLTIVRQALLGDENENQAVNTIGISRSNEESRQILILAPNTPYNVEEEEELYDYPSQVTDAEENGVPEQENLKQYSRLKLQILIGGALGLLFCLIIGGIFIVIFYHLGSDLWAMSQHYYEGILSIVASLIISVMGLFFLRIGKLREKFRVKLATIIYSDRNDMLRNENKKSVSFSSKYAFFILPFVTALREGLEAVVFIGGVGIDQPLTSIPLSMLTALALSSIFGYYFFRYSSSLSLKICLVVTTCFLYLIASGLFSKGVWQFELQDYVNKCHGQDMTEVGSGPGSYDISRSVWHINCCNGETDGGWMILTAIFGWTNSATYGSVISYIIYWLCLVLIIKTLQIEEEYGYITFLPISWQKKRIIKRINIAKSSIALRNLQRNVQREQQEQSSSTTQEQRISKDSTTPLMKKSQENVADHGTL